MTPAEKERIAEAAEACGLSVSDYVRQMMRAVTGQSQGSIFIQSAIVPSEAPAPLRVEKRKK